MGINHGGADIGMAQQFLNGSDIAAAFEQMGRETVSEGMDGHPLGDLGLIRRLSYVLLEIVRVHVVSSDSHRSRISR